MIFSRATKADLRGVVSPLSQRRIVRSDYPGFPANSDNDRPVRWQSMEKSFRGCHAML